MNNKQLTLAVLLASQALTVNAQNLDIVVTNLTQGIYYTPILIAAHSADNYVFKSGMEASPQLQMMAEGGNISGLSEILMADNADLVENPAAGMLAPAMSVSTTLSTTDGNTHLSLVSMMLPTNDGFVGLNSWKIPEEAGTYTLMLNAYDAGTEANDEIINGGGAPGVPGIPVSPADNGGTGALGVTMEEDNTMIHIHRGSLGDDDLAGGKSDLDNRVHRWLNPVAKVTITVN